jgi:cytochrome P450
MADFLCTDCVGEYHLFRRVEQSNAHATTHAQANYTFFLAMTLYPEIQRKAQAEMDRVIGTDRLPTLDDRKHLTTTDALVKEVLRWQAVAPQGNITLA